MDWTFNFDATAGTFGFANSLFQNPRENVEENLSDQWLEGSIKPKLSGVYTLGSSAQVYGAVSAVGERTFASVPDLVGPDISSFKVEDLSIGWRSGKAIGSSEHVVDLTLGRARYRLGHGMILFDGGSEGGSRGGYWTNARQAFEFAAIGRVTPGPHRAEVFYLDRDELPESDSETSLWGANYEFGVADHSTFGITYLKFMANPAMRPGRDGLNVFNLRAYTAPIPGLRSLSFEAEYAGERNGDLLSANATSFQAAYELSNVWWTPTLTYRYARFSGDDPDTAQSEAFDSLLTGFYDWGTWWQGEIAGEYFLSNSNLLSHMARLHVEPHSRVSGGVIFFQFLADEPSTFGPGVASKDIAVEADVYVDWKINNNFSASFVTAFANPQAAAEQAFSRTKNFAYGMAFIAYSY